MNDRKSIKEVAAVFFKLGCIAFGGPAAHIAMMEQEIVNKRKWMDRQHFLDLIGATNLIPGPNSTEMTMHCGHERAGWLGLFTAGICFIFPAVVITGVIAWLYGMYGTLPEVAPFVAGIKPAVIAIIAVAVYKLGKKAVKNWQLAVFGGVALLASFWIGEVLALLATGVLGALYFYIQQPQRDSAGKLFGLLALPLSAQVVVKLTTIKIFWTFLKVGAVLYGSGYVLFAYLDAELVAKGWLSHAELMDAVAVGQFTPGPVLSTATFIGYQLNGFWGALAATAGIFLPSFLLVLLLNPLVPRMRKSIVLGYFLDTVNVAAVAVMLAVLVNMGVETMEDWRAISIAALGIAITLRFPKINAMWLVIGGAVMGYLLFLIQF